MTYRPYLGKPPKHNPKLIVGERVIADCRRRVHELSNRFRPTAADRREIAKLKEFLRLLSTGGDNA